jgi:hypothetical protein
VLVGSRSFGMGFGADRDPDAGQRRDAVDDSTLLNTVRLLDSGGGYRT